MKDFGKSRDPAVQAQLDRLNAISLASGRISLETIETLLTRLGDPQDRLPPVFHVAGTNGKGSTCAFLRAMLEAQGYAVHATTSPHLVRINERIRIAGKLIKDGDLAALIEEVLDQGQALDPSFFEVVIAASFLAFSRSPADACVIEVGLGGRLDATNVIAQPAICGIAALGIDHEKFLLAPCPGAPADPLARIAWEKAGIARRGVPLVCLDHPAEAAQAIADLARSRGANLISRGRDWYTQTGATIAYTDAAGELSLPLPTLPGAHQAENAGLALAMLRHQRALPISERAMAKGIAAARWPARLQQLQPGPLAERAKGRALWLDGGHNRSAGQALAAHFAGQKIHLILGMLAAKDRRALIDPLDGMIASLTAVPVPGHEHHPASAYGEEARAAPDITVALAALPDDGLPVLIAGSLYLAGEVLRLNQHIPR